MHYIKNSWISKLFSFNSFAQKGTDFLSLLPDEIILLVFSYLNPISLLECSKVSRRWKNLTSDPLLLKAFDLRKIFPLLKVFDESDWVTHVDLSEYGLSIEDAPELDKRRTILFLNRCLSLPIEGNAGITLLTIPKGLTVNKAVKLAGSPKMGNITQFSYIWTHILSEIGDIPVDKTYRVVITNNVLKKRQLGIQNIKVQ